MTRRPFAITFLCALAALPLVLAGQSKPITMEEMHKLHQDSTAYIAMLDDPARDADQKPHEVVMALGLGEGERIAVTGSTHDARGFRKTDDPRAHSVLVDRINRKILKNRQDIEPTRFCT